MASGVYGYRRELSGQRSRIVRLGAGSLLGGAVGAVLLLSLPSSAFAAIVPVLIVLGLLLVVFQPRISAWVDAHARGHARAPRAVVGLAVGVADRACTAGTSAPPRA